jgi:hypothetical protein
VITHIDVSLVLRRQVSGVFSNLVTRSTGAAVRNQIEREVESSENDLTVLDFSHVNLLDFSCADEVVAKLLLRYTGEASQRNLYFMLRGVNDSHLDAIEAVLERHRLALMTEVPSGDVRLIGDLEPNERRVWEAVNRAGFVRSDVVAAQVGLSLAAAEEMLDSLCRRRLIMRREAGYAAVRTAC